MRIVKHSVVSIDYTLTNGEGEVIDSSKGRGPLTYIQGNGNIIPGLESALEGKTPGESLNVTIPPEEAYGAKDEALIQSVPRDLFRGVDKLEPGMQFQANNGQETRIVTIVGLQDDTVLIDANHPLAGATLNFDVTIVEVRAATPEEIEHGHVHGPGGHHH